MNCSNCDFSISSNQRYCGQCGNLVAKTCPACNGYNPLEFKFCGHCGSALEISSNRFGRQEPSATYSYFPASSSALSFKSPSKQPEKAETLTMLSGERRVATVMVADVMKSTDLLGKIGSESWVELMRKLLQVMEAQIYRFGGQVDQFRGDGLVAFFGARDAHEDDPERAVLAALAMQEGFERYKMDFEPVDSQNLKLRIGINTDELIVAQVGTKGLHREDTAMGEAIALAARLEAVAEPGTILVSEATYKLVAGKFHWIDLLKINIKGITEPVHVYRPIALRTDAEILREMQTYIHSAPLIGRHEEYDLMRQKVDQVLESRGEIVLISGERGLGKSFLVQQVHKDLSLRKQVLNTFDELGNEDTLTTSGGSKKVLWLRGWCHSYEQPTPFFIWRILLKSWLGDDPDETEAETLTRLIDYCEGLWPERSEEFLPIFASLLGIKDPVYETMLETLDAQGYQGKLFYSMREWLSELSGRVPLVLSLGSVQWANAGSIELLRDVISLAENNPVLWFIVYRPDKTTPMWSLQQYIETEFPHRLSMISLKPFSEDESKALIEYILQPNKLDDDTMDVIVDRTEGNPFFIRELVNSLVNDAILLKDEVSNQLQLTNAITASDLPESLQSLFLSRIDKLSQLDRLVLQIASVVGFVFWKAVIEEIAPPEIDVLQSLNNLQKVDLIAERGSYIGLGSAFNFTSTLIKDVTYESILSIQRKTLHLEIGEFLKNFLLSQEISPNLLAHHYQMAENLQSELFYRIQAAEESKNMFANQEAFHEYSRALEILDELEAQSDQNGNYVILTQRFELVKGRIEILYHLGRVIDAEQDAHWLLRIADQIEGEPIWRIDALLMQPGVNYVQTQEKLEEGIPQAEEALHLSQQIGDPHREMMSLAAVAGHRFLVHDPEWHEMGQRAVSIADELNDKKTKVQLLLGLAGGFGMDKLEVGLDLVKQAQPIAKEINYKGAEIELLYWLGTEFEREGDYYTLLKDFEERRLQLARDLGWRLVEARALMFVGQIKALYLGDYEAGLTYLQQAENFWEDVDQRLFVYLREAQIYTHLSLFDKARHYLDLAEPLSLGFVQSLAKVGYDLVNAIMDLEIGSLDSLMRVLEHTQGVLHVVEEENLVSRQYRMAAACKAAQAKLKIARLMKQNHDEGGYEYYSKKAIDSSGLALDTFKDFGFTQIVEAVSEEILYTHGLALVENGKSEEGEVYIKKAHVEVMRKFKMIPEGSHYRKTYMAMNLHKRILEEGKRF